MKSIYKRVQNRPEYVIESIYKLFYKVPQIVYRLVSELKQNRNKIGNIVMLTVIYQRIIEDQVEKIYIPSLLNSLTAINLPF